MYIYFYLKKSNNILFDTVFHFSIKPHDALEKDIKMSDLADFRKKVTKKFYAKNLSV